MIKINVIAVRALLNPDYDVYHDPVPGDSAHANLVRYGSLPYIDGQLSIAEFRRLEKVIEYLA